MDPLLAQLDTSSRSLPVPRCPNHDSAIRPLILFQCSLSLWKQQAFGDHVSKYLAEAAPNKRALILKMAPLAACPAFLAAIAYGR